MRELMLIRKNELTERNFRKLVAVIKMLLKKNSGLATKSIKPVGKHIAERGTVGTPPRQGVGTSSIEIWAPNDIKIKNKAFEVKRRLDLQVKNIKRIRTFSMLTEGKNYPDFEWFKGSIDTSSADFLIIFAGDEIVQGYPSQLGLENEGFDISLGFFFKKNEAIPLLPKFPKKVPRRQEKIKI